MTEQTYYQPPVGTQRQSDPYWFRKNSSNTFGVTAQPSNVNPQLGIEDIVINSGSQAQLQHGILASCILKSIVGSISFQIKLSKAGHPFVQTVSTETGKVNQNGEKEYWEHIMLKPAVKAQIMRFYEALQTGSSVQMPAQQFNQAPAYGQPQYGQPQGFAPQAQSFAQPQYGQVPAYGQQFNQAPAPALQMDYSVYHQMMAQNNNVGTTPVGTGGNPALEEDDLPV